MYESTWLQDVLGPAKVKLEAAERRDMLEARLYRLTDSHPLDMDLQSTRQTWAEAAELGASKEAIEIGQARMHEAAEAQASGL